MKKKIGAILGTILGVVLVATMIPNPLSATTAQLAISAGGVFSASTLGYIAGDYTQDKIEQTFGKNTIVFASDTIKIPKVQTENVNTSVQKNENNDTLAQKEKQELEELAKKRDEFNKEMVAQYGESYLNYINDIEEKRAIMEENTDENTVVIDTQAVLSALEGIENGLDKVIEKQKKGLEEAKAEREKYIKESAEFNKTIIAEYGKDFFNKIIEFDNYVSSRCPNLSTEEYISLTNKIGQKADKKDLDVLNLENVEKILNEIIKKDSNVKCKAR